MVQLRILLSVTPYNCVDGHIEAGESKAIPQFKSPIQTSHDGLHTDGSLKDENFNLLMYLLPCT